jgi:hypothetical protein
VLSLVDDISNAMVDSLFILASGALASVTGTRPTVPTAAAVPPPSAEAAGPFALPARRLGQPIAEIQPPGVLKRRLPSPGRRDFES